jgi:hypothetical protein
VRTLAVRPALQ